MFYKFRLRIPQGPMVLNILPLNLENAGKQLFWKGSLFLPDPGIPGVQSMGLGAEVSADSDTEKNTLSTGQSSSRSISGPNMQK